MSEDRETQQRRAVGVAIREARLRKGLSQTAVARVAGITQPSLSNYELGKRDMPLTTAVKIFAFLRMPILLGVTLSDDGAASRNAFVLAEDGLEGIRLTFRR